MFEDVPENYKPSTADKEEEGWRYTQGDKNSRRPPELLTRDHVARCINREVKAGRGSPHGGVFLDIAWIKQKLPDAEKHIQRKLPSMERGRGRDPTGPVPFRICCPSSAANRTSGDTST